MLRFVSAFAFAALAAGAALAGPTGDEAAAERNARINAPLPAPQAAMKSHVMFLASDALRGREAGAPEYEIAAQYVASQFYEQGLVPAGDNGSFLQNVPLLSYKSASKGSFLLNGQPLEFGVEYLPGADPMRDTTKVDAEVVFVGYGIVAPQFGIDDYKGAKVKGRIVAFFGGAPRGLPGEERAHFGNAANKAVIAQQHGAIGTITLESPVTAKVRPFERMAAGWDSSRMTWANPDGTGHVAAPGAPSLGGLSMAAAAKLFAGAKRPWDQLAKMTEDDKAKFKPELLKARLAVSLETKREPVMSWNVAGLLPGSDPTLSKEVVVLTAHLDHIGVGRPDKNGDTINNGAMDNAVGIASLIEEARRFKESGKPPRRSILFLAVTAEEKGLVGADYFANNPTLAKERLVANVNLDMPILTYKFDDVIVFGAQRSSLGPIVEAAAKDIGVTISPDPMPDQGLFTRSDHYRFVQQGIPSVFLWPGEAGPGKAAVEKFFAENYHKPSDEISGPIDWESGARFIDVNYRIARAIADAEVRPLWNKGDFFGTLYKGPVAP
ncbi:M28 family metallopeptidase [Sphingomonas canadensis]|uniref:M28 family metallopeptidase n=1 Tax=Sphingomonas canadensis TaxID=1219257 RepID=A0ABW3HDK9_9SPHN|nr:M28 family metallopeptidase [Sphingomonas canadensis]MCW3837190.1 M28 family metallopeptidase [Sphingomonas canadensis]